MSIVLSVLLSEFSFMQCKCLEHLLSWLTISFCLSRSHQHSRGRRSSSEGRGPKLWTIGSHDVVSLHFLRIGKCLEELELERKAAACLVFSKFVSTWETCLSSSFLGDFVTFSLKAKWKVEWKETAHKMIDEERQHFAMNSVNLFGSFLFRGRFQFGFHMIYMPSVLKSIHSKSSAQTIECKHPLIQGLLVSKRKMEKHIKVSLAKMEKAREILEHDWFTKRKKHRETKS